MADSVLTPQLDHWRGTFGNEYVERNEATEEELRIRLFFWGRVLPTMAGAPPKSILEVGCNIGNNFRALRMLTTAELHGLEPNASARARVAADGLLPVSRIYEGAAQKIPLPDGAVDLAYTTGVLTHIHPNDLKAACSEVHRVARRYVMCSEHFGTRFEPVSYRGHDSLMFRGDYGAFYLDNFPDLELVDYGFFWHRANGFSDGTWWVFRKRG